VFRESQDPVLIASEVAAELPIGRRGVYKRLEQLAEDGKLERKKIGGRGTVWWLA
jgi:predicted ArsR family transcriptional regulator